MLPLLVLHGDDARFPCSAVRLQAGDTVLAIERVADASVADLTE
jgi:hypothetical protein